MPWLDATLLTGGHRSMTCLSSMATVWSSPSPPKASGGWPRCVVLATGATTCTASWLSTLLRPTCQGARGAPGGTLGRCHALASTRRTTTPTTSAVAAGPGRTAVEPTWWCCLGRSTGGGTTTTQASSSGRITQTCRHCM